MKILLLGKNGQVGWELQRSLPSLGTVLALDRNGAEWADVPWPVTTHSAARVCGDLAEPGALVGSVLALRPDVVVNAAAYTAVDKAESEPEQAHRINVQAPAALASACDQVNALLVHYSTDYVFDGRSTMPYAECDATSPQSVYGRSKLDGEAAIRTFCRRHLILRTSWVFGAHGGNFLKTILRLAQEKTYLSVVIDQWGSPTSARFIADATATAIADLTEQRPRYESLASAVPQEPAYGTYHLTCSGRTSWHCYAVYLLKTARMLGMASTLAPEQICPISTAAYPTPAVRPAWSVLDTTRLQKTFGIRPPMWEVEVAKVLLQLRDQIPFEKPVLQ